MTGDLVYLDSSAIVKLAVAEPESVALFAWLADHPGHVTSALARVEVGRALRRVGATAAALRRATSILDAIAAVPVDRAVIEAAGKLDPPEFPSLDAIHLATALSVGTDLAGVVTYDERLAAAAARARVEVWAPDA